MKSLQDKQQGLRTRLRHNQREIQRLLMDYENFGLTVVNGNDVPDMDTWLVNDRPKRRAQVNHSPGPIDYTQTTDGSTQPSQPSLADSQISDAASEALGSNLFSDSMITQAQAKTKKKKKKKKKGRSTRRLGCPIHRHLTHHISHGPKRRKGSRRRRKSKQKAQKE